MGWEEFVAQYPGPWSVDHHHDDDGTHRYSVIIDASGHPVESFNERELADRIVHWHNADIIDDADTQRVFERFIQSEPSVQRAIVVRLLTDRHNAEQQTREITDGENFYQGWAAGATAYAGEVGHSQLLSDNKPLKDTLARGIMAATEWDEAKPEQAQPEQQPVSATAVGPTGEPKCPHCGNSLQNGIPAGTVGLRRCATCKAIFSVPDAATERVVIGDSEMEQQAPAQVQPASPSPEWETANERTVEWNEAQTEHLRERIGAPLDLGQFEGHTPGEWKADCFLVTAANGREVTHTGLLGRRRSSFATQSGSKEDEVNAKLIAAAPALLAEVRRLRESEGHDCPECAPSFHTDGKCDICGGSLQPLGTVLRDRREEVKRLRHLLDIACLNMEKARGILTDSNPRPECNWGMLDTREYRAALHAAKEPQQ